LPSRARQWCGASLGNSTGAEQRLIATRMVLNDQSHTRQHIDCGRFSRRFCSVYSEVQKP
jgi:hypothetical protein